MSKFYNAPTAVLLFALLVFTSVVPSEALAQRGGFYTGQNENPDNTELLVARWRFGHNGWFGGSGWAHNYPEADQNLSAFIAGSTAVDITDNSYRWVHLESEEIFDYPFAFISEPGEMNLSEQEVENLREYIARGGFVVMDDFDGLQQLDNMRYQVNRAFPDRKWVPLEIDHPIFRQHFELENLHGMDDYVSGGYVVYYALFDEHGEISMVAGYNNDLMNFWEWYNQPGTPIVPSTDAFRLGVNYMIYALTH